METTHLNCECYSPEHTIRVTADKQSASLWLEMRLNYYPKGIKGFIVRARTAVLYFFGISPEDGHFDTFCFSVKEAAAFRDILDDFVKSRLVVPKGQEANNDILI